MKKDNYCLLILKKYKVKVIVAPLIKLFEVVFEILIPFITRYIIDFGINKNSYDYVIKLSLIMFALAILGFAFTMIAQYISSRVSSDFGYDLKMEIYQKIQNMSEKDLLNFGKQKILTIINNDSFLTQNGVFMFMRLFFRPPFLLLGSAILCFIINIWAGLIFLIANIFATLTIFIVMKITGKKYLDVQNCLDKINKKSEDILQGLKVVRSFNKVNKEIEDFENLTTDYKKVYKGINIANSFINPLTFFFINLGIILIVYLGNFGISQGFLTSGQIVSLVSYLVTTFAALVMFSRMIVSLNKASASMKRINHLFSYQSENNIGENKISHENKVPILEFKNVYFSYNSDEKYILKNISFKIYSGETFGIIGLSGSGKSTIVSLIGGLYKPNKGEIFFKGTNINLLNKDEYLNELSLILQKPSIYYGNIASNITITDEIKDENKMILSAKNACAFEFIDKFDDKFKHIVQENGSNLSGGQKQRLLIARALYKNASLLILDDITSALDYLTDKKVRNNLLNYPHLTKIIISQRVSTIKDSNKILLLDNGEIKNIQSHEELLLSSPLYKNIYEIQKGMCKE